MNDIMRKLELNQVDKLLVATNVTYGVILIVLGIMTYYGVRDMYRKQQ